MKKIKLNYIIIPLTAIAVSVLGSLATNTGLDWYRTLYMPYIAPSGQVIGMVWTVLYILITISALIYFNKKDIDTKNKKLVLWLFIANAILNALWSAIFFGLQMITPAIVEMIILEATIIALIVFIWKKSLTSSVLLIPYALWVGFATFLAIWTKLLN